MFRSLILIPALLLPLPARAQPADPMAAIHAMRWTDAQSIAATYADPVVAKLVTYYRLLTPAAAATAEIAAFIADSPDWPQLATLARRRDDALALEPDDAIAAHVCQTTPPATEPARARCAEALIREGQEPEALAMARSAWEAMPDDPAREAAFLQRWGPSLTARDQWRRFDRFAWTDTAAAHRQAARLDPADRPEAEARLALRRDDPAALALLAALPSARRAEPALVLEQARYLRRANRDAEALALWQSAGTQAERQAPQDQTAAFWAERNLLARRLLRDGNAPGAYAIAAGHAQTAPEPIAEAEFLAGFIALRRLNDAPAAVAHFKRLAAISKAAITQGRAHYWLARATGDAAEYRAAAAWPNTFYGQLAIIALHDDLAARIRATRDPAVEPDRTLAFAGREVARAAAWLVAWGEPGRAQSFLLRLDDIVPDPADRALVARLAQAFALPETAIALARRAGRDGVILLDAGWPVAARVPDGPDSALILGIIRQESSFDPATVSTAGARGLMQLMPGTAAQTARAVGIPVSLPALTADSAYNIKLGTAYLRGLLDQYGGSAPLAVAAYNAGPGRVAEWLGQFGDPRAPATDPIDWIELIPFNETRNYVQRVIENAVIYQAHHGDKLIHPLARAGE